MLKERNKFKKLLREKTFTNNESEFKFRIAKQIDLSKNSESII